jgi:hypothetical protein
VREARVNLFPRDNGARFHREKCSGEIYGVEDEKSIHFK